MFSIQTCANEVLLFFILILIQPVGASGSSASVTELARQVIEVPRISDVRLSPDGKFVLYVVSRRSVPTNNVSSELLLRRTDAPKEVEATEIAKTASPTGSIGFNAAWCPDSKSFTYFSADARESWTGTARPPLVRYAVASGTTAAVPLRDDLPEGDSSRPRIGGVGGNYKWDPSGRLIAFTAPLAAPKPSPLTRGVRIEGRQLYINGGDQLPVPAARNALFVLDVSTGRIRQVTPPTLTVQGFEWSPDSRRYAIAGNPVEVPDDSDRSDLFLADAETGRISDLLRRPGGDSLHSWSPDGRWIAIKVSTGLRSSRSNWAVISSVGDRLVRLKVDDPEVLESPLPWAYWSSDSRGFHFIHPSRMTHRIMEASVGTGTITALPHDDEFGEENLSFSADAKTVAFVRSRHDTPPELMIRTLPDGEARELTKLSSDFPLGGKVKSERLRWKSRDGATVYGLLLTPTAAILGTDGTRQQPLPTLVYVYGGPSMVYNLYNYNFPEPLILASHGYAVFIPNTRGRNGYGRKYYSDMYSDPVAVGRIPYEDVMSGVDELVKREIADEKRLGIFGQSYGGFVTAFTVTQTHRFRAAANYEGVGAKYFTSMANIQPRVLAQGEIARMNIDNPLIPENRTKLLAISPGYNTHCVATPTFLTYGAETGPKKDSAGVLFGGLQRFGVPVELVLYHDGHVYTLPSHKMDLAERLAAWFDYWVRGLPYTDARLQAQYDAWWKANQDKRKTPPPCATEIERLADKKQAFGAKAR